MNRQERTSQVIAVSFAVYAPVIDWTGVCLLYSVPRSRAKQKWGNDYKDNEKVCIFIDGAWHRAKVDSSAEFRVRISHVMYPGQTAYTNTKGRSIQITDSNQITKDTNREPPPIFLIEYWSYRGLRFSCHMPSTGAATEPSCQKSAS